MVITVNIPNFRALEEYVKENDVTKFHDGDNFDYISRAIDNNDLGRFDFSDKDYFKIENHRIMDGLSELESGILELSGNFIDTAEELLMDTEEGRKPTEKEKQAAKVFFSVSQDLEKFYHEIEKTVRKAIEDAYSNVEDYQ